MRKILDLLEEIRPKSLTFQDCKAIRSDLIALAEDGIELSDEFLDLYNYIDKCYKALYDSRPLEELRLSVKYLRQISE